MPVRDGAEKKMKNNTDNIGSDDSSLFPKII